MEKLKEKLRQEAIDRYGEVYPLERCFTEYNGKLIYWFNVNDHSTRILAHDLTSIKREPN